MCAVHVFKIHRNQNLSCVVRSTVKKTHITVSHSSRDPDPWPKPKPTSFVHATAVDNVTFVVLVAVAAAAAGVVTVPACYWPFSFYQAL